MKSFKIRDKEIKIPIIQGGMGVGISMSSLATAVINEGGMGTISASQIGFNDPDFFRNTKCAYKANVIALKQEIKKVRDNTPSTGFLGVNILSASSQYAELAKTAVEAGADAIVSGAGLPLDLPLYTRGSNTSAIPIVSSSRVLNIIIKKWTKKYDTLPDAVVIEGPLAGGHLGVKYDELDGLDSTTDNLEDRLIDVVNYRRENNYTFPLIVAGGVFSSSDVKRFIDLGADGVQVGTRFIATAECDANIKFKERFIEAEKEDIVYVKSPVGYPARAIKNDFTELLKTGHLMPKVCINCVMPCQGRHETTPYCISDYLVKAVNGDTQNGLVFCGANGYRLNNITTVRDLIKELTSEIKGD